MPKKSKPLPEKRSNRTFSLPQFLIDDLQREAALERRSAGNMLETILIDRYGLQGLIDDKPVVRRKP